MSICHVIFTEILAVHHYRQLPCQHSSVCVCLWGYNLRSLTAGTTPSTCFPFPYTGKQRPIFHVLYHLQTDGYRFGSAGTAYCTTEDVSELYSTTIAKSRWLNRDTIVKIVSTEFRGLILRRDRARIRRHHSINDKPSPTSSSITVTGSKTSCTVTSLRSPLDLSRTCTRTGRANSSCRETSCARHSSFCSVDPTRALACPRDWSLYCGECYLSLHPDPPPERLYIFPHALRCTASLGVFRNGPRRDSKFEVIMSFFV
ncbi:hypothetical protein EDB86DRAFT_1589546 [Lactarius hatsudake]|nr:hypothetical protein EDB86DRAFT_1589546 [Lactarius hatsudake]